MKTIRWLVAATILATFLPAGSGCKKAEPPPDYRIVNGVRVDMPKLEALFASSTSDSAKKQLFEVDQNFRYGDYPKAAAALEELATNPDVTEDQKKVIADVLEQLKKVMAATPGAAPAQ